MKNITIIIATVTLALTSLSALALGGCKDGKNRSAEKMAVMQTMLDLSDEQVTQIAAIRAAHREKMKAQFANQERVAPATLDPTSEEYQDAVAERAKAKAEKVEAKMLGRAEMKAEIFTILTPDQQEKFIAFQETMKSAKGRASAQ